MDYRINVALVAMLVAATVLVGCEKKETAGEPPIQIGMAPGEFQNYKEPTPVPATTVGDSTAKTAKAADLKAAAATSNQARTATTSTDDTATTVIPRTYTIGRGDTLFALARRFYGNERKWRDIWNANRDKIPNKNVLPIGTEIVLP